MKELKELPITIKILEPEERDQQKLKYIKKLSSSNVIAIGNGKNDVLMLKEAALSIGIIQDEGAFYQVMNQSQVICININDILSLLINPKKSFAMLRN